MQEAILKAGSHPVMRMVATGFDKQFYELANNEQLTFFPKRYLKSRIDMIDHTVGIIAEHDMHELQQVNPQKIIKSAESKKKVREWMMDKEYRGEFTWTLALYGTPAMAQEAKMSLKAYWEEIIKACYLQDDEPIERWRQIISEQKRIMTRLNTLQIKRLHVVADTIDLTITLGEKRKWVGGSGRNMPSFELFTSPDWRGTEGMISFNQPLYRYGNLIEGIRLQFAKGRVTNVAATKNEKLLKEMLERPDANKVGEFSLTDKRFSPITKFMANTLYDENVGGRYGNTHIAVGSSYKDAYDGDPKTVTKKAWKDLGFNQSGEHCDMMSTQDRVVTAELTDGTKKVIYSDGSFVV
jgi:aminopeptidase